MVWDPIGVCGHIEMLDESGSYVSEICQLLRKGTTYEELKNYLLRIEVDHMGLHRDPTPEFDRAIEKAPQRLSRLNRLQVLPQVLRSAPSRCGAK